MTHYIDNTWVLQETIIDFSLMSEKHNDTNILNKFFNVLKDFNIISKINALFIYSFFIIIKALRES